MSIIIYKLPTYTSENVQPIGKNEKKISEKKTPEWDKIHTKKYNLVKPYCALFVPKSTFSFTVFSVFRDCRSKEKC